jgi:alkanesulfonate monooxygenase SsuD/methylene tetrahydromethanopterin reductase-like flavin-dependent oxidoreductase (luciferase family)
MRIGPMIVMLPLHSPVQVAEELLLLDHLSGGRLEVGLGRGTVPREYALFGVPFDESAARFAEGLDVLLASWAAREPRPWSGTYYHYDDVSLPWPLVQQPHPPIWIPTATASTARELARRGFHTAGFPYRGWDEAKAVMAAFADEWRASGRSEADMRSGWLSVVYVAQTSQHARDMARRHLPAWVTIEYDFEQAEQHRAVLCGSPAEVTEKIAALHEDNANTMIMEFNYGQMSWAQVAGSMELFASAVAPAFSIPAAAARL